VAEILHVHVTLVVRSTGLRGEMMYEAIVSDNSGARPTHGDGETPAQAARRAIGWFVNDHVSGFRVRTKPKPKARRKVAGK
jgi:hypothetical protein